MPGPLIESDVIEVVKNELLGMTFATLDTNGNPIVVAPSGAGVDKLATAIGGAMFKVLKQKVLVNIQTGTVL